MSNAPKPNKVQDAGSGTAFTVYKLAAVPKVEPDAPALAES
jgi:hypothetical protein